MLANQDPRRIQAGSQVVLYANRESIDQITIEPGKIFNNRYGHFHHDDLIGKEFGTKVYSRTKSSNQALKNQKKRKSTPENGSDESSDDEEDQMVENNTQKQGDDDSWLYAMMPRPSLWSAALKHRTEILYNADIALVTEMLELKPGSIVLESGTGSGSLSTHLSNAIAPNGHLYTFEFHQQRSELAREDFARNGLSEVITVECRDIVGLGFPEVLEQRGTADAVFLDLPAPWNVVDSAKKCLKPNGMFCSFSPCIEQVQKTCAQLAKLGFCQIRTVEILERPYSVDVLKFAAPSQDKRAKGPVKKRRKLAEASEDDGSRTLVATRPIPHIRGHTGYLSFARKFVLPAAGSVPPPSEAEPAQTISQ